MVSERDQEIVEQYKAGATLEAIAAPLGITRERVRQIVNKVGGASADEAREARAVARAALVEENVAAMAAELGDGLSRLAARGLTREQVERRLSVMFPSADGTAISLLVERAGQTFDKLKSYPLLNQEMIEAGVLYLIALDRGIARSSVSSLLALDQLVVDGVAEVFANIQNGNAHTIETLQLIAAARDAIASDSTISISNDRYDRLRSEFLADHGIERGKGRVPWPPTSQTVAKRLGEGGWSDALRSLGLDTSATPKGMGQAKYAAEDYEQTVIEFLKHTGVSGEGTTYAAFEQWLASEKRSGRPRPSAPAVRGAFRSWNEAVRSRGNAERINRVHEKTLKGAATETIAAYDRMAVQQAASVDKLTARITELDQSDSPSADDKRELDALSRERELVVSQLELTQLQKRELEGNAVTQRNQFRTNVLLAAAALTIALGSMLVPIFEYWSWWPLGGK